MPREQTTEQAIRSALRSINAALRGGGSSADWDYIQRRAAVAERLGEKLGSTKGAVELRTSLARLSDLAEQRDYHGTSNITDAALAGLAPLLAARSPDQSVMPVCSRRCGNAAGYVRAEPMADGLHAEMLCLTCLAADCQTMTAQAALGGTYKLEVPDVGAVLRAGRQIPVPAS